MSEAQTVLVIGATGYVGGRLVPELLERGHRVRVLARRPGAVRERVWADDVEVFQGDVLEPATLADAFDGCDAAYYLVHSIGDGDDFEQVEARAAENTRDAADTAGVRRLIYLGGLGHDDELSVHLRSRHRVGEILASGDTSTIELRAAVVIGSGSLSFEMLRYLTEVLPVMTTPTWVQTRCQPIAIRDVLHYLAEILAAGDELGDRVFEIGGPDILTYAEMMQTFARVAGLRKRVIIPVPLLSPGLSSRWVGLVTPLPAAVARPLIDSLAHEVTVRDRSIDQVVPHQPIGFERAVELALERTRIESVQTRWADSGFHPADAIPGDPDWSGGRVLRDEQSRSSSADAAHLYAAFSRVGGDHGYYVMDAAWRLRGIIDRLVGGPGLRRGRRHPTDLRPGETVDFWRVRDVVPNESLILEAEMRLPGLAWLMWNVDTDDDGGRCVRQTALFAPRGLWGRLYWYSMYPFHFFIFARMLKSIVDAAEAEAQLDQLAS